MRDLFEMYFQKAVYSAKVYIFAINYFIGC